MTTDLDQLLSRYESGTISRRDLLAALAALVVATPTPVQAQPTIGEVTQLNHVTIFVPDVQRSVAFYQGLLGMPVLTPQEPGINLNAGSGFLGIYPAHPGPPNRYPSCLSGLGQLRR